MSEGDFIPGKPVHFLHRTDLFPAETPVICGVKAENATSKQKHVTCADCLTLMGVGATTPRQKPPYMNDKDDGVFEFYDVDYYAAPPFTSTVSLEVVPQTTGNVEIICGGTMFTLSHLDRADLIRALLHDFHYSPERGGPNDDQD